MTMLRNIFELLKEFVSLPRRAIFLGLGVWALGWLIREYFLYRLSEGAVLSVRSASRFRVIDFTVNYFLFLAFFLRLVDFLLIKIKKLKNNSEMDK